MNMMVEFDNVVEYDRTTLVPKTVRPVKVDLASLICVSPAHSTSVNGYVRTPPADTMQYVAFGRGGVNIQFMVSKETADSLVDAFNRHFCRGSRAARREVDR